MSGTSVLPPHTCFTEEWSGLLTSWSGLQEKMCPAHMFQGRSCQAFYDLPVGGLELHFHVFWCSSHQRPPRFQGGELDTNVGFEKWQCLCKREVVDGAIGDFLPLSALLPQFTSLLHAEVHSFSPEVSKASLYFSRVRFQDLVI